MTMYDFVLNFSLFYLLFLICLSVLSVIYHLISLSDIPACDTNVCLQSSSACLILHFHLPSCSTFFLPHFPPLSPHHLPLIPCLCCYQVSVSPNLFFIHLIGFNFQVLSTFIINSNI